LLRSSPSERLTSFVVLPAAASLDNLLRSSPFERLTSFVVLPAAASQFAIHNSEDEACSWQVATAQKTAFDEHLMQRHHKAP
jgi:hypothetical protein